MSARAFGLLPRVPVGRRCPSKGNQKKDRGISPGPLPFSLQREKEENLLEAKWNKSLRYYSFFFRLSVLLFAACIRLSFPPPCVLLVERTKTLTPLPARIIALMIKSREENGKRIDGRQGVGHVPATAATSSSFSSFPTNTDNVRDFLIFFFFVCGVRLANKNQQTR